MSLIQPSAVKAIALSVDITHLSEDAAKLLAPDVEYRLREVIQDALKIARHCKRTQLTTQDINNALRLRNMEPLYGFLGNPDPAKFVRAAGFSDVYFVRDSTVPLEQITCAALPRAPAATTVTPHWLFIDGQQPATEENAPVDRPAAKRQRTEAELGEAGRAGAAGAGPKDAAGQGRKDGPASATGAAQAAAGGALGAAAAAPGAAAGAGAAAASPAAAAPVQHILSDEMQRLFEEIKSILGAVVPVLPGSGELWAVADEAGVGAGGCPELSPMQRAVLTTLQQDPGMQQLMPYLSQHVVDEVAGGVRSLPRLHMALRLVKALLLNPAVALEPYLAQLMPPLLTCMLAKSLGASSAEDHWSLRDAAAQLVARLCARFGEPYYGLQVKISKQLIRALLDGSKPLTSHYGAVVGLAALGHATVRLLLIPQLEPYIARLQPALEAKREGVRQYEATRVYGAIMQAAGAAMYDKLMEVAADGLPYHLFLAPRSRRTPAALNGDTRPGVDAGPSSAAAANGAAAIKPEPAGGGGLSAILGPLASLLQQPAAAAAGGGAVAAVLSGLKQQLESGTLTPAMLEATVTQLQQQPHNPAAVQALQLLREAAAKGNRQQQGQQQGQGQAQQQGQGQQGQGQAAANGGSVGGAVAGGGAAQLQANGRAGPGDRNDGVQAQAREPNAAAGAQRGQGSSTAGGASGARGAGGGGGEPSRTPRAILAESWREDADLGEVVWALVQVFGPGFLARLPQPGRLPSMTI